MDEGNSRPHKIALLWEWRFFILFLYLLPLHEASKNVLWGLLAGLYVFRHIQTRRLPHMEYISWGILIWIAAGIWSSCFAINIKDSWKGVWDMVRAGALFWIAGDHLQDEKKRLSFFRHLLFATFIACLIGWRDYAIAVADPKNFAPHVRLQIPSVGHFNHSATYLAMIWTAALAASLTQRVFSNLWIKLTAISILGASIIGTTSRTALVAVAMGTLLVLWKAKPPRWMVYLILGIALIFGGLLVSNRSFRTRIVSNAYISIYTRVSIWGTALEKAKEKPWTGLGLNNFKQVELQSDAGKPITIDHAHNLYINSLVLMGWPGLLALLNLLGSAAIMIWKSRSWKQDAALCFYPAGGAWLVAVIGGIMSTTLHHEIAILFFLLLSLVSSKSTVGLPQVKNS